MKEDAPKKALHCPKCNGVIYNRRNKLCGFCGAQLPVELLFTPEEIAALDKEANESEARHRRQKAKAEKEEEEKRIAESGSQPWIF
jgi:hypothetical protein